MNHAIIAEFRANAGKVGGQFDGMSLLLLTTIGARTGEPRTWPLAYHREGDRLILIAANGGRPRRPGWYHNLIAHPDATVEVGTGQGIETRTVHADVLQGADRERAWETATSTWAPFVPKFQQSVPWEIPVIALTPTS